MKRNAFNYHQELSELERLISNLEHSMEWVESALNAEEDPSSIITIGLSFAKADLNKSYEKFKQQQDKIIQLLSNIYP